MTMSRYEALARRLVLVLGLGAGTAACEASGPLSNDLPATPPPVARSAALPALEAEADAELAHLRALQIVEVRDLVLQLPDASSSCYGPCSADAWDQIVTEEYRRQVPRLHALGRLADGAIHDSYPYPVTTNAGPQDVEALNAFEIVNLGALLVAQPANNPLCYNTPCPEDVQKADEDTGLRAFYLRTWITRAQSSGKL
jgi:hypothetical protein